MEQDTRTIVDLARKALDVQDACNLSGVVLSWGRSIRRLRRLLSDDGSGLCGTDDLNRHPVNVLWVDKVAHLTGTQIHQQTAYTALVDAYNACSKLAAV